MGGRVHREGCGWVGGCLPASRKGPAGWLCLRPRLQCIRAAQAGHSRLGSQTLLRGVCLMHHPLNEPGPFWPNDPASRVPWSSPQVAAEAALAGPQLAGAGSGVPSSGVPSGAASGLATPNPSRSGSLAELLARQLSGARQEFIDPAKAAAEAAEAERRRREAQGQIREAEAAAAAAVARAAQLETAAKEKAAAAAAAAAAAKAAVGENEAAAEARRAEAAALQAQAAAQEEAARQAERDAAAALRRAAEEEENGRAAAEAALAVATEKQRLATGGCCRAQPWPQFLPL